MRTVTLVSLGLGGAGVATGAGFAINNYINKENIKTDETITQSIKERIDQSKKSKSKVFLIVGRSDLEEIKTKYDESQDKKRPKPKGENGKEIDKEKLVEWCSDNVNAKFNSEEDELYKSIISWCYINSNTLEAEMGLDERQIYSAQPNGGKEWEDAWAQYSANKETLKKVIAVDSSSKLNGNNRVEGGKALETWCATHKSKKLYEDNMEEAYELFKQWCTKTKA